MRGKGTSKVLDLLNMEVIFTGHFRAIVTRLFVGQPQEIFNWGVLYENKEYGGVGVCSKDLSPQFL